MTDILSFGKVLSDPTRVRILNALIESDLCVCEMVDALEMGQSTLSAHLQTIRQAGIVDTTRRHKMISYALCDEYRPIVLAVFDTYRESIEAEKRVKRDRERIHARLRLRKDEKCVLGPGQLDQNSQEEN